MRDHLCMADAQIRFELFHMCANFCLFAKAAAPIIGFAAINSRALVNWHKSLGCLHIRAAVNCFCNNCRVCSDCCVLLHAVRTARVFTAAFVQTRCQRARFYVN